MGDVKRYTRITRTGDGGSTFEDAELQLTEQQVADGVPRMFVGGPSSSAGVMFLRSAAFDSDPHPAPRKQWVLMLRGAIEVEVSDGTRRRFEPGDLVLVNDTTGKVTSLLPWVILRWRRCSCREPDRRVIVAPDVSDLRADDGSPSRPTRGSARVAPTKEIIAGFRKFAAISKIC